MTLLQTLLLGAVLVYIAQTVTDIRRQVKAIGELVYRLSQQRSNDPR